MSDGLEGVVAARTVLSDVDGQAGHLIIRGYSLDDLAGRTRFEDVAHLLFDGFFDDMPSDLTRALGEARVAVFAETAATFVSWEPSPLTATSPQRPAMPSRCAISSPTWRRWK